MVGRQHGVYSSDAVSLPGWQGIMLSRCGVCNGTKMVKGLGGISKKCPTCKGIGHVSITEAVKVDKRKKEHREKNKD